MAAAKPSPRASLLLALLLVGAFGLRLWDLGGSSIWHDEGWSIRAIRDPVHTPDDNTPPVYYAVMHLLWRGAGETPLALRYGSVLLDLLTVAFAARLIGRWAGQEAALLAVVLLGASPLLWAYAREIRAYVAVPLLALVLLALVERLTRPHPRYPWRVGGALLLAELALLYTHNLSVPVVGWLNLAVAGAWLWGRRWRWLAIWLAGQGALLLAYFPWLLSQEPSGTPINTPPRPSLALAWDIWQGYFAPLPAQHENALVIATGLFGIAAAAGMLAALAWADLRRVLLLVSQAVVIPVLATVELWAAHIDFHPRYYVAGLPAALLLLALGITSLGRDARRLAVPAVLALAAGTAAASLIPLIEQPKYQHDDFRALAAYYATLPGSAVIVIPYGWEPALEEYYAERVGLRAEIVGVPLHSTPQEAIQRINAALAERSGPAHVELLTWYQLPADLRGMYPCLLEPAGRPADPPGYTVQGIITTGYEIEHPLALPDAPFEAVDYGVMVLDSATWTGETSICVQTAWQLRQNTRREWRVSARLLTTNPPGWALARSDSDIRQDDQLPTQDWQAGDRGDAFSLLRLPPGTPPGSYAVQMVVFDGATLSPLNRLIDGIPSGTVLPLAEIEFAGATATSVEEMPESPVVLGDTIELAGHDAEPGMLTAGQELRITLYFEETSGCCATQPWQDAALVLSGTGWEIRQPVRAYSTYSRDWHSLRIPADARGPAALAIQPEDGEPVTLAAYTVEQTDHLFAPPAFEVPVGAEFHDLAVLEGFSVAQTAIPAGEPFDLALVWRALETPALSYRVFTHLLGADGRVIAQRDDYPVGGARLTTGWLPGEYIADAYTLEFLPEFREYRGPARLEVGFYDPDTGRRVPVAQGADFVMLPVEMTVR